MASHIQWHQTVCTADHNTCFNGGTCEIKDDPTENTCKCPDGYWGALCHGNVSVNPEDASVCTPGGGECKNGAVCVQDSGAVNNKTMDSNYCSCSNGYFGTYCKGKHSFPVCEKGHDTCQNGGKCVVNPDDAKKNSCECVDDYVGALCHGKSVDGTVSLSVCTPSGNECQNGGGCIKDTEEINGQKVGSNYCHCPKGTFGALCHGKHTGGQNSLSGSDSDFIAKAKEDAAKAEAEAGDTNTEPICTENGNQCQNGGFCVMASVEDEAPENYCKCPEDYHGNRCHSKVENQSSNQDKPVCTKNGDECLNGGSCVTGTTDPNKCECINGFFGAVCRGKHSGDNNSNSSSNNDDDDVGKILFCKNDNICQNGGTCVDNARCECVEGYHGDYCHGKTPDNKEEKKSVCTKDGKQCKNDGVCVLSTQQSDGSTASNYCKCPDGTSGAMCQDKDVCELDCKHGSSCRSSDAGFYCECVGDYKGLTCDTPFQTCPKPSENEAPLVCLFGGECVEDENASKKYTCDCPKNRSGEYCESGVQSTIEDYNGTCNEDDDCFNGGLCIKEHDAKKTEETGMLTKQTHCLCKTDFGGDNCEFKCESLECQHGSSCRFSSSEDITHANDSTESGAFCDCKDDHYKGRECEIAVQKCPGTFGMECLYGGSCVGPLDDRDGNFYTCDCPTGRKGTFCEMVDTYKAPTAPPKTNFGGNSNFSSPNKNTGMSTSNMSESQSAPSIVLISVIVSAFLLVVPLTLILLRRNRYRRNAESNKTVADTIDGASATTDDILNVGGANAGQNVGGEDIFDYDTEGVVDVKLDENEPVELPKDKQIV